MDTIQINSSNNGEISVVVSGDIGTLAEMLVTAMAEHQALYGLFKASVEAYDELKEMGTLDELENESIEDEDLDTRI